MTTPSARSRSVSGKVSAQAPLSLFRAPAVTGASSASSCRNLGLADVAGMNDAIASAQESLRRGPQQPMLSEITPMRIRTSSVSRVQESLAGDPSARQKISTFVWRRAKARTSALVRFAR